MRVYNYVSGTDNPISFYGFRAVLRRYGVHNTPRGLVYHPDTLYFESKSLHYVLDVIFHLIPALLGDAVMKLLGKKPM